VDGARQSWTVLRLIRGAVMFYLARTLFSAGAVIAVGFVYKWTKSWDVTVATGGFVAFLWGGFRLVLHAIEWAADKMTQELDRNCEEMIGKVMRELAIHRLEDEASRQRNR
jgi:hypothetical protein